MDDTARKVLGTTSMPHNKTKCMRAILAENVSEPPTNVGKLPRGLEIGGSRGGPPALHRTLAKDLGSGHLQRFFRRFQALNGA